MSEVAVDTLRAAIDALADIDLDTLTDTELDTFTITVQRQRHRLAAVAATSLARWETRGVWCGDGSRSSATRLARDAATSVTTARIELRRARRLASMPAVAVAVATGRLSMDHVDLLGAADTTSRHHCFARDEAMLVEDCATLRHAQAVKVLEYWKHTVDATLPDADEQAAPVDRGHLHASPTLDGTVRLDGMLDPIDGAIVLDELNRLERELYLADERAGVVRTRSQRYAAALTEMATRSASTPPGSRRPRPLFSVLLGDDSFTNLCELANGTVLTPDQLVPHLGAAEVETILFADPTTIISTSTRRSFTGRLRRAIEARDRHCQHPSGCDIPAPQCDVDHIIPDLDGGPTAAWNGRLQCRPHNRDTTKHDHHAQPHPQRDVDIMDELRAVLRWRLKHEHPDEWAYLTANHHDHDDDDP
jgi:hypothetical protein